MRRTLAILLVCGVPFLASCANGGATWERAEHPSETLRATVPEVKDFDTPAYKRTRDLLEAKGNFIADKEPMEKVLASIAGKSGVNMVVNWLAMEASGVDQNTPVTMTLKDCPWRHILTSAFSNLSRGAAYLGYTIDDDGVMIVSTKENLDSAKYLVIKTYDIGAVFGGPEFVQNEYVKELEDTIMTTVAPDSWHNAGGQIGSIRELNGQLVIGQTMENQRAVANLLRQLQAGAFDRVHVYDVRDLVGIDDKKFVQLMDMLECHSSATTWVDRNGYLAVMHGINGRIYVTGPARVQKEVAHLLELLRANKVKSGVFNVLNPTGLPQSSPPPLPNNSHTL